MKGKGITRQLGMYLCLSLSTPCFALDLVQAYNRAVQFDPELQAQRYANEAEQFNLNIAKAALLPTVTVAGQITRNHQPRPSQTLGLPETFSDALINDTSTTRQASVTARQPLFRLDAWRGYAQVKTSVQLSTLNFQLQQQQQLFNVAEAYFNVLRQQALRQSNLEEQNALQAQLNMMQAKLKQGLVAQTDVREAQAQFDNARANRLATEIQLQLAQEQLAQYIGAFNEPLADLDAAFELSPVQPTSLQVWLNAAQRDNLQLQQARLQQQYNQEQQQIEQAARYPQLNAFASYAYNKQSPETIISTNGASDQVGVELSWNVFNGGRTQASIVKAQRKVSQASAAVDQAANNAQLAVKKAFLQLQNDQNQTLARKSARDSAQLVARMSSASYQEGLKSMVDVLLAQRNAYAAQQNYINSQYDYVLHVLQLKAAVGQLNLDSLNDINAWLVATPTAKNTLQQNTPQQNKTD